MKSTSHVAVGFPSIRCVFVDRDGVINRKAAEGKYINKWDEFELLPGVEDAIGKLNRRQFHVVIISNQRGIALGLSTAEAVENLQEQLQRHLAAYGAHVDAFYYCPHDEGECDCRKPATGLLKRAARDFRDVTPETSVFIGDSLSDIEAAINFGCWSIFVQGDPATRKRGSETAEVLADALARSLPEAVDLLLQP